jgi:hypothetical protein
MSRIDRWALKTSIVDATLAPEAKIIVALAFRNGPIKDLHAGKTCPTCSADCGYFCIPDEEMKGIMKADVNTVYSLLWKRESDSEGYAGSLVLGARYTQRWDDPEQ